MVTARVVVLFNLIATPMGKLKLKIKIIDKAYKKKLFYKE